jgi:pyruvate/2-oxoglutarate dehydrogenase complex dihydrolipoamide dehydrogenase (E3) component
MAGMARPSGPQAGDRAQPERRRDDRPIAPAVGARKGGLSMDRFDFVVIGAGAAGEAAAHAALERGKSVAVVDRELFGGSCSFWACIPSKTLLHAAAQHRCGTYPWSRASDRRDYMINRERRDWPDDSGHVHTLEEAGATLFRGVARIAGPRTVEVRRAGDGSVERLEAANIVVATGSQSKVPPIEGLAATNPWTNREATSTRELPRSLVVLGGGASGVEMASVFARFGVETALVHSHDRIMERDHARNSEAIARILRDDGVELRLGARANRVRPRAGGGDAHVIELSDGGIVEGHQIMMALGREFQLDGLGLEAVGVDPSAIQRDGRLRVADGVFLIGDPAGPELFTHVSHYQGGLAVRMALGEEIAPDYRAIPRAVYVEPEVASVGVDIAQARAAGADAFELAVDLATTARGYSLEAAFGHLAIVVDRPSQTLLGASVVAPDASAAIHEVVLAIQARISIPTLAGMLHAFPSTSRSFDGLYADALRKLRGQPLPA